MLAAMTHPSRVLNLDMKAKLYIYISIYIWVFSGYRSSSFLASK